MTSRVAGAPRLLAVVRNKPQESSLPAVFVSAGALLYSSGILIEALLGWPIDPRRGQLSELAAKDSPHRRAFVNLDLLSGAFCIAGGVASGRNHDRSRARREQRLAGSLILFGCATLADAFSPLDTAISNDAPRRATAVPTRSLSHRVHAVTSGLASLGMVGVCVEQIRERSAAGPALGGGLGEVTLAAMAGGLLSSVLPKAPAGIIQRMYTIGFSLTCLDLARRW